MCELTADVLCVLQVPRRDLATSTHQGHPTARQWFPWQRGDGHAEST